MFDFYLSQLGPAFKFGTLFEYISCNVLFAAASTGIMTLTLVMRTDLRVLMRGVTRKRTSERNQSQSSRMIKRDT